MSTQYAVHQPWPGEVVGLSGGRSVHVRHAAGSPGARAVLLVHGLGGSSLNWTDLMAELSGEVDAWALDLPGYGESPPAPDRDYGVGGLGRALGEVATGLVERTGGPVHVVGNSMGGLLSVLLAARSPELVRTLALLSPALPARRLPRQARLLALLAVPRLGELALRRNRARSVEDQTRDVLASVFGDPGRVPPERLAAAVLERTHRLEQPHADEVFLASLRSIVEQGVRPRAGIWAQAGRVIAPTLVVYGGRDRLVHRAAADRWRRTLPTARTVLLPSTGHVPQIERPALVAELLREHWSG